jgi:hypothetical protein
VSPGFILPFCRYRPVQADAGLPAWSSLPTELEYDLSGFSPQGRHTIEELHIERMIQASQADPALGSGAL